MGGSRRVHVKQGARTVIPPQDVLRLFGSTCFDNAGSKAYREEFHTPEQHAELGELLLGISGMVALSGRPGALYADLYEANGWQRHDFKAPQNYAKWTTDSLWVNPALMRAREEERRQMTLPLSGITVPRKET